MVALDASLLLPVLGGLAGVALGFVARSTHFCTLSALERFWYAGDSSGIRCWALASLVALAATQLLVVFGFADPRLSFYLASDFPWTGAIAGGLMFGFGMALVGTCGFGAVLRLGGGSLRALVVLTVIGLSALAAQRGLVGLVRRPLVDDLALSFDWSGSQSLGDILATLLGLPAFPLVQPLLALLIAAAGLWWVFRPASFRRHRVRIAASAVIGLVIAFGWAVTTQLANGALAPVQVEAGSFVVPVGDTILQLITYTGTGPDYGVGLVVGTVVGAALAAFRKRDIRWEACDDARELGRHILGGTLMGVGGVFAMGCTVGQTMTGFSALAISAPVVTLCMVLGARLGLSLLVEGSLLSAFRRNEGTERPSAAE
ncbi:YeeE/YedE family protein [Roseibium aestuarii]|uniref:YeeE/YedE family protein n=1 Tax=Roseibium aestuarii TaxID=2600299 RepID=A0ABW4JWB0_9HYPH|nr:YeeE/YedE family protein [Roseibium aestuarii]